LQFTIPKHRDRRADNPSLFQRARGAQHPILTPRRGDDLYAKRQPAI